MNEFSNPARRILQLVKQIAGKPEGKPSTVIWAEAFGLDTKQAEHDPHEVLSKLMLLREEIDLAEKLMADTPFSAGLYKPYFDRVRSTISLSNISASWGNFNKNLQAETQLALRYCSEILPPEPDVSIGELQNILDAARRLREEIGQSELNSVVREFLLKQLTIIEKSIQDYPIRGGVSIKNAFKEGFADCIALADAFPKETNQAEISKIGKIWRDLRSAGKEFVEADRIAASLAGLAEKGRALLDLLN